MAENAVFLTKPPLVNLSLIPRVQFVGEAIAWDISDSYSATSTISTFDIDWGGATDIGDLVGQLWASDPLTGNVEYDDPGTYTVTASVTDVLGKTSSEAKITVTIIDPAEMDAGIGEALVGTTDGGLYVVDVDGTVSQENTGLTGNHPNFRMMRLHPAYRDLPNFHLWACTEDGLAFTVDGADNWQLISKATFGTPENAAADSPAPATADLDQIDIAFDSQDPFKLYVLRTTASRAWLYISDDYGLTWTNYQVNSALAFYDPVLISEDTNPFSIKLAQVDTDKITVSWRNVDTPVGQYIVAIDIASGTIGTEEEISTSTEAVWSSSEIVGKTVAAYVRDNGGDDHGYAVIATVTGTSIVLGTEGAWYTVAADDVQLVSFALNDGGNRGLIASRIDTGGGSFDNFYSGITTSGSIAFVDEDTDTSDKITLDNIHLVQDTWVVLEGGTGLALSCRVVDFGITTVTAATRYDVTGPASVLNARAVRIDNDRFLVVLQDSADKFYTVVGEVASTVISYGTVVDLEATTATIEGIAISRISGTQFLIACGESGTGIHVETLSVSGTTITRDGDLITAAADYDSGSDTQSLDVLWLADDKKVVVYKNDDLDLVYRIIDRDFRYTHSAGGIPGAII